MKTLLLALALALAVPACTQAEAGVVNTGTSAAMLGAPFQDFYTAPIDLTVTGTYQVIPPVAKRFDRNTTAWEIKTKSGTISTNPTWQVGANAAVDNLLPSQTPTGFTTNAVETSTAAATSFVTPTPFVDLTTNGLRIQVTVAATGTNPVLTARFRILGALLPK
jgi:hypothetical protein